MTVYLGNRRVDILHLGRAHTAGDAVVWVPDQEVMFTGDIVEYHSACYCGDGHFADWPDTLANIAAFAPKAIAPGRGSLAVWSPGLDRYGNSLLGARALEMFVQRTGWSVFGH